MRLNYNLKGDIALHSYNDFSDKAKEFHLSQIRNEIVCNNLIDKPDDSYAVFMQTYFPTVWKSVLIENR